MQPQRTRPSFRLAARRLAAVALVAAGVLVATGAALALEPGAASAQVDNSTPQTAAPFTGTANGQLAGGGSGHFAYYSFTYAGNQSIVLNLQASPNDQAVLQYVGFKVYGPTPGRVYASASAQKGVSPSATATLFSQEAGQYVVQVYSFAPDQGATVTYTLSSPNLPRQAAQATPTAPAAPAVPTAPAAPAPTLPAAQPTAQPTPAADNSTPAGATQLVGANAGNSGSVPGGKGGHFNYWNFQADANQSIRLNLTTTPNDPVILQYAGFKVYGPTGRLYLTAPAVKVTNTTPPTPNATGLLQTIEAGIYTVQVYNYAPDPNAVVTYALSSPNLPPQPTPTAVAVGPAVPAVPSTAAPAPAPAATSAPTTLPAPQPVTTPTAGPTGDITTPSGAAPLTGTPTGTVPGGHGGHFVYYKFTYPGDQRKVTVNLNVSPQDPAILQFAGFKVYGPTGHQYASAGALKGLNPSASATFTSTEPGTYTVQVYNYAPDQNASISYTLSASGL